MTALPPVKRFVSRSGVRIYRIGCRVFEDLTARVYLLIGAGPPTIVDTGGYHPESMRQILAGFESLRAEFDEQIRPEDVRRILVTHCHTDHIGGLEEWVKLTGAEIGVHPFEKSILTCGKMSSIVERRRLRQFFDQAGMPPERQLALLDNAYFLNKPSTSFDVAIDLEDGLEMDGMKFVHVPGHSPGLVCIAIDEILLCADHILAQTVPQQWPERLGSHMGLSHYFESLEKTRRLEGITLGLAAHEQVMHNIPLRIDAIRAAHERRLERLLDLMRDESAPLSLHEISLKLYPEVRGFRGFLAVTDVASRVEYLYNRNQLVIANLDEVATYDNPVWRYAIRA